MGGVPWTEEEDHLLKKCIEQFGEGKWHRVPLLAGLNRCRKSCRLRWLNYLRPNIKRGSFTQEEVDLIIKLHKLLGNRWSLIAGRLPGRTANDVKNYWNCHLSKKLTAEQIGNEQEENIDDRNMPIFRPLPQNLGTVSLIPIRREQEAPMPQPNPPPSEVGTSMPFLCAEDGAEPVVQDEHKQSLPIEEHAVVLEDLPIDFEFDDVRIDGINNNRKWDWDDLFHGHGPLE